MKSLDLSLRQKKLLHAMQHTSSPKTSYELASQLNVSTRTIRNDVVKINDELAPHHAQIVALKSKGYEFQAEDPKLIESLNQIDNAFFSKENRVRYLAFELCLAEEPLNVYDLEDEMFISHTTLEHALRDLSDEFCKRAPRIRLIRAKDFVSFEEDEIKRRAVLNRLLRESWNYHARSNAYYQDDFIDNDVLDFIIDTVSYHLDKYDIEMEDPCIVSLNLIIAIMYYRIIDGHFLAYRHPMPKQDADVGKATDEILDSLEKRLECYIGPEERDEIYLQILSHRIVDISSIRREDVPHYFGPVSIQIVDEYLKAIRDFFRLDMTDDDEFYLSLLQFIQNIQKGHHTYNEQFSPDVVKRHHRIEMVLANLFQPIAREHLGYELNETRLIYLSYLVSGGLDHFIKHHPGRKIRTVIACHMNQPVAWALKRKARFHFGNHLEVTDLLPVYKKNSFDFSNTDLVLTTVQKKITNNPSTTTLYISEFFNESDQEQVDHYIMENTLKLLYSRDTSLVRYFRNAWWHECCTFSSVKELMQTVTEEFVEKEICNEDFQEDILSREKNTTYAIFPGVVLLYSLIPARKTQFSITTMDHRITWNSHKIRIVVTAAFSKKDMPLVMRLTNLLYEDAYDLDSFKMLKTKPELQEYISNYPSLLLRVK